MVVVGHRMLTFLGLTSLVATMVMITRYNLISSDSNRIVRKIHNSNHHLYQKGAKQFSANKFKVNLSDEVGVIKANSLNNIDRNILPKTKATFNTNTLLNKTADSHSSQSVTKQKEVIHSNLSISGSITISSTASSLVSKSLGLASTPSSTKLASSPSLLLLSKNAAERQDQMKSGNKSSDLTTKANNTTAQKIKTVFDAQDLKSTQHFLIDKPLFCDADKGATLDLLVVVTSAVYHFEARQAIRKTWGAFAVERGALLLFLLGALNNATLQENVIREEQQYGDLLQGSFIDNYYNLTLKNISLMRWVNETCNQVKYVLKVDDDMFVNMQMMVDFSETRTFNKAIIGKLARKWRPHRDPKSKWFVPTTAFNGTLYPNFATGPAYMFSGDATHQLLETSLRLTPIYPEDVYMTGIVAEKANVRRLNHALIKNVRLRVDGCTFKRFMTSHKHTPQEIETLWKQVYEMQPKACNKPKLPAPNS